MFDKRIWQWSATYFAGVKAEYTYTTESNAKRAGQSKTIKFTQTTYAVAVHIANEYADWKTGEKIFASQGNIADNLGVSRLAVQESFIILQAFGMMVMTKHQDEAGGKSNWYDLTMPPGLYQAVKNQEKVLSQLTPPVRLAYTTCKPTLHHVLAQLTQTTNRTTNLTTKVKTKEIKEVKDISEDNNPGKAGAPKINLINDDIPLDSQRVKVEGVSDEVTNTKEEDNILDSIEVVKEETTEKTCKESLHLNPMKRKGEPTFKELMERRAEMLKNKPKEEKVVEESSFTW